MDVLPHLAGAAAIEEEEVVAEDVEEAFEVAEEGEAAVVEALARLSFSTPRLTSRSSTFLCSTLSSLLALPAQGGAEEELEVGARIEVEVEAEISKEVAGVEEGDEDEELPEEAVVVVVVGEVGEEEEEQEEDRNQARRLGQACCKTILRCSISSFPLLVRSHP